MEASCSNGSTLHGPCHTKGVHISPDRDRVAVLGLGYVGSVTAAGLAHLGHRVIGVDRDMISWSAARAFRPRPSRSRSRRRRPPMPARSPSSRAARSPAIVVADGQPVPDATVYAGRTVFGNGTTSSVQLGRRWAARRARRRHQDHDHRRQRRVLAVGVRRRRPHAGRRARRDRPIARAPPADRDARPDRADDQPREVRRAHRDAAPGRRAADGVLVTCQSTSTPGRSTRWPPARRRVSLRPARARRLQGLGDARHAEDRHAVLLQADRGAGRPAGDPRSHRRRRHRLARRLARGESVASARRPRGSPAARSPPARPSELSLKLAAAGPGAYQRVVVRAGEPAQFTSVAPGRVHRVRHAVADRGPGRAAPAYFDRHGDALPTFCKAITVAQSPDTQTAQVAVQLPPFIPDGPGPGSGQGPGSGR